MWLIHRESRIIDNDNLAKHNAMGNFCETRCDFGHTNVKHTLFKDFVLIYCRVTRLGQENIENEGDIDKSNLKT